MVKNRLPKLETKEAWFHPWVGKIPWKRKLQPTPVFLPGTSRGQKSLQAAVHRVSNSWTLLKRLSIHKYYVLFIHISWALLVAQTVQNPPAMQKTQV